MRRRLALGALAVVFGLTALVTGRVEGPRTRRPDTHEGARAPIEARDEPAAVSAPPEVMAPAPAPVPAAVKAGPSTIARLEARYRPEDLDLLADVSRITRKPPPRAIHRLVDAARTGASRETLARRIHEDVDDVLLRRACHAWLRAREGDPKPKLPAFATRTRR